MAIRQVFPASTIWTISYTGAKGGGDTFTNNTSLSEMAAGNGGNNQVLGGSSWNLVYLWGNNNSYDARVAPATCSPITALTININTRMSNVTVYHVQLHRL